jgi:signal transduction histidine kinase
VIINTIKMEQNFLQLINAAVSHELRNPLSSIISQVANINDVLQKYKKIVKSNHELKHIHDQLSESGNKVCSASKFLDFFVHDILDYTMLNKDETEFHKKIENFNIRDAVNEIIVILNDKVNMKDIQISV